MRRLDILAVGAILVAVLLGTGAAYYGTVDQWTDPDFERRKFKKLIVIGITDDREARHRFEDLFVSHLRGMDLDGLTSYSVVKTLGAVENEEALLRILEDREIDGVITVRAVALKSLGEPAWADQWKAWVRSDPGVRALVADSLPVTEQKSTLFGVEAALWDMQSGKLIWGGRTSPLKRKQMRKGSGQFVQYVMRALEYDELM